METAVISQSEMVVTSPTTESAPVPEGYGTTPDHIILQPDKTGGLGDIGRYINSEMTTKEVEDTVIALSRGQKYELLTQHFSPVWSGLCCYTEGWGGKCSEILATIKLLYNPRVNKVFTFTFTSISL